MLISFSGTQGSGKTTLINALVEKHKGKIKVMERKTARSVLADWMITLDDVYGDLELMKEFQQELVSRKYKDEQQCLESDPDAIWLVERSYADLFAYTTVYAGKHNSMSSWLNDYFDTCRDAQSVYDGVVYVNGGMFGIDDDGIRPNNVHYGNLIHLFLTDTANQMTPNRVPIETVEVLDLSERVEQISQYISNLQQQKV